MGLEDLEVHKLAKQFSNEIWEIVLLFNYFESKENLYIYLDELNDYSP